MASFRKFAPENLGSTSRSAKKSNKPKGEKIQYGKRKKNEKLDDQLSFNRVKTLVDYFGTGTPTKKGKLEHSAADTAAKK